jgi:hypothetical protein
MYVGLHVKSPSFFQILISFEFSRKICEKYSNIRCHKNPISGSRAVLYGRTNRKTDRQTDVMKLIVAVCNFAKAPEASVNGNCAPVIRCSSGSSCNALVHLPRICLSQQLAHTSPTGNNSRVNNRRL